MLGGGNWPNDGEIDIMENIGREPNTVHGTIHGPGYSGAGGIGAAYNLPDGQPFADDFHTFAVDWEPNSITWFVDGVQYQRRTPADLNGNTWVYNHPFFLILNVAVGGYWPGYPDGSTVIPQTMTVDYVRVSSLGSSSGGTPDHRPGRQVRRRRRRQLRRRHAGPALRLQRHRRPAVDPSRRRHDPGPGQVPRRERRLAGRRRRKSSSGPATEPAPSNGPTRPADDLVNPQANKCLDVTGNNSANATPLQIWTCTGAANQKWTV